MLYNKKITMVDSYSIINTTRNRSSNLELYRVVCMLLIVAHHYVVLSGLTSESGPMETDMLAPNSIFLYLFGGGVK